MGYYGRGDLFGDVFGAISDVASTAASWVAPVAQVFKTIGTPIANAVGLPHMLMNGAGVGGAAFNPSPQSFRSMLDPTQTMMGSPTQGVLTGSAPWIPARFGYGRRSRRRRYVGYPPEYQSMMTGAPPQTAPLSPGGYRGPPPLAIGLGAPPM